MVFDGIFVPRMWFIACFPLPYSCTVNQSNSSFNIEYTYFGDAYDVWVSDPKTGKVKVAYQFTTSGSDMDGVSEAINNACSHCHLSMSKFIEAAFPLGGSIIALDEVDDDEAKTVYIDRGSLNGIKTGLKMDVMIMQDVAGTPTPKVIGTLTAKEVTDSRTLCSVNDGAKKINDNFNSSVQMTIRSRAKKGFFKTIGNVMEGFGSSSVFSTKTGFPLSTESIAALERDFGTAANVSAANISTDGSQSQSQSFVYYDFSGQQNKCNCELYEYQWG